MAAVKRWARLLVREWKLLWILFFALVAVADFIGCWPVFLSGWTSAVIQITPGVSHRNTNNNNNFWDAVFNKQQHNKEDQETCYTYSASFYNALGQCRYVLDFMGPLFCLMCIFEAVQRAQKAREDVLDMAALDKFEHKLARFYASTRGWHHRMDNNNNNMATQQDDNGETEREEDDVLARRTIRVWTPVIFTLSLWSILLPWQTLLETGCGGTDSALVTLWISHSLNTMTRWKHYVVDTVLDWAWHVAFPFPFWEIPKLYARLLVVLRWVRYFRFAGPLFRMLLKLNDQFYDVIKTTRQAVKANAEKTKRTICRSMLFDDIKKIETSIKQGLSRVPTVAWMPFADKLSATAGKNIKERRDQEKKVKRELTNLKERIRRSSKVFPSSDIYDRIVDLSQEFTNTLGSTLWTANLISPQTRFSVSWRIVVTCALVSELCRLCTAYQMYGRVDVTYTSMMVSVLGCANNKNHERNLLTATGRWTKNILRQLVRLPPEQIRSVCTTTSFAPYSWAHLLMNMSFVYQASIDIVCFLDIYVWFFTGELDPVGRVVPKPFFYRCILPGTLVQVLDHPTVPDALPKLLFYCVSAASAVGYGRLIRWLMAVAPSINIFVMDPIKSYLFRPMEDDEWLRYTESLAIIPAISGADIRYTVNMSHPDFTNFIDTDESTYSIRETPSSIFRTSGSGFSNTPTSTPTSLRKVTGIPTIPKKTSFLPSLEEPWRHDSRSAGLSLDSQTFPSEDALYEQRYIGTPLENRP